jgi:serine/threonine protein phosphatase 1
MRNLLIGDIHGMYDELSRVLKIAQYSYSDRLICLGDYINRGKRSREVMEFLVATKKKNPANVYLQGNHEKVLLSALSGEYYSLASWLDLMHGSY